MTQAGSGIKIQTSALKEMSEDPRITIIMISIADGVTQLTCVQHLA